MDFGRALDGPVTAVGITLVVLTAGVIFFGTRWHNSYERGYNDGVRDALDGKVKLEMRLDTTEIIVHDK